MTKIRIKKTSPYQNRWKGNCLNSPDLGNQHQANLQNKRDTDKEQKTVPLIPDEKPPTEDNNLVTIGETETENITSAKPDPDKKGNSNVTDAKVQQTSAVEILAAVKESDNKDQPTPAVEVLAAVKETTEEPNPLKETQLQSECTENPPISFGGNLENLAWIDAEDEPWEYGMQLGILGVTLKPDFWCRLQKSGFLDTKDMLFSSNKLISSTFTI